jgi:predicted signal transduction protein with EAL and GGDEF domain
MSFGVSASPTGSFDYDHAFEAADQALYTAKAAGGNCVRVDDAANLSSPSLEELESTHLEAALSS